MHREGRHLGAGLSEPGPEAEDGVCVVAVAGVHCGYKDHERSC